MRTIEKILVTGHKGYLGRVLTRRLEDLGYLVQGLDVELYELGEYNGHDDIRKARLTRDVDCLVHLAAIVGEPACTAFKTFTKSVNYDGTLHLMKQAAKLDIPMIFASTCSVYGAANNVLFEDSKTKPLGSYAMYRLEAERKVLKQGAIALRFGTLFGWSERMRFDLVINKWAKEVHENKPIMVDGGDQWRPFCHVQDAARAIVHAMESLRYNESKVVGEVFNVASVNTTILELANAFRKITDCDVEINDKVSDIRNYLVNSDKIKVIGWEPEMSIGDGIIEITGELKTFKRDLSDPRFSNLEALKKRFPQAA